jgi:hypothetical protein
LSSVVEHPGRTSRRPRWVEDAERLDRAIYAAVAGTPTLSLDVAMSRLSRAADYSRLSLTSAALLALTGGRTGRRAALTGLAAVGVTATVRTLLFQWPGRGRRRFSRRQRFQFPPGAGTPGDNPAPPATRGHRPDGMKCPDGMKARGRAGRGNGSGRCIGATDRARVVRCLTSRRRVRRPTR